MGHIAIHTGIGVARNKRWLGAALVGVAVLVVWQLAGTRTRTPAPPSSTAQAISQHCAQFVAIARASFGPNWKPRLDPTDPLCAGEIQRAWERQNIPRNVPVAPPPVGPYDGAPAPLPIPPQTAQLAEPATAEVETSAGDETYCLNVLGLARSRFGENWRSNVTARDAAKCRAQLR